MINKSVKTYCGSKPNYVLDKPMNNEPVAYVNSMCNDYIDWKIDPMSIDGQSLYTHPAKTLTDEEKDEIIAEFMGEYYKGDIVLHQMISAILRKAQEK